MRIHGALAVGGHVRIGVTIRGRSYKVAEPRLLRFVVTCYASILRRCRDALASRLSCTQHGARVRVGVTSAETAARCQLGSIGSAPNIRMATRVSPMNSAARVPILPKWPAWASPCRPASRSPRASAATSSPTAKLCPRASKPTFDEAVAATGRATGATFGDATNPLLLAGALGRARISMPGMMDTILNLGLNDVTVEGLARRRATSASPTTATAASSRCTATWCSASITALFDDLLDNFKNLNALASDTEVSAAQWREMIAALQGCHPLRNRRPTFPQDTNEQLWGAIDAVFALLAQRARGKLPPAARHRRRHGAPP